MNGNRVLQNRDEAARELARKLSKYKGQHPLLLAIPRGGVGMAKLIARELEGDLDVVLVHKLGYPENEEYAIGAVDEDGNIYLDEQHAEVSKSYLKRERDAQLQILQDRRNLYTPVRRRMSPKGRVVIIVDDGIATGWTIKAAIHAIRKEHPKKIIVAAGVGSPESVTEIKRLADEVVCLDTPSDFFAVGQFYQEFPPVSDEEVVRSLASD